MLVNWIKDVDAALRRPKLKTNHYLIDFSAAPA